MSGLEILVAVETVLLVLLAVVVVGLLRSHAEVLRRLPDDDEHAGNGSQSDDERARLPNHPPGPRLATEQEAPDVVGVTLDGSAIALAPSAGPTLLAFLSSGCLTCRTFWDGLRAGAARSMPGDARVMVVVKDPELESPSRLRDLAPADVPVVQSSEAWSDYGVTLSPYFLFVGGGVVRSEGAASSWEQVSSLLRDAIADERMLAEREEAR